MHDSLVKFNAGKSAATTGHSNCVAAALRRLMGLELIEGSSSSFRHDGKKQSKSKNSKNEAGHSRIRRKARKDFLKAIMGGKEVFCDPESLPSLESAYMNFLKMFPRFSDTLGVDAMRADEYVHLRSRICLDYSGFGLFSHLQRICNPPSSSFRLAYVSANLPTHALFGSAEESSLEGYLRRRIMEYFRLSENDYCMVFTASKGSAVKLLAESYRFDTSGRLVTAYDHRSQSIEWMIECARDKGARVSSGVFQWPSLRICSKDLKKQLEEKKLKKDSTKGLFVFPLQSRVTGARYSYQWIPLAQQNQWHVLLDASALGPRDMDALGLSVFSPDFIVSSFYKVFGADPSGFGCLFIKKSSISCLYNSSRARAVGMVKLLPCSGGSTQQRQEELDDLQQMQKLRDLQDEFDPSNVSSFSGPLTAEVDVVVRDSSQERDVPSDTYKSGTPAFDRTTEELLTRRKAESDESSSGSSFTGGGTITVLYPIQSEEAVIQPNQIDVKRKGRMFEIGESSSSKQQEDDQKLHQEQQQQDDQTQQVQQQEQQDVVTRNIFTLKELLSIPEEIEIEAAASRSYREEESSNGISSEFSSGMVVCKALDQTKLLGMSRIRNRLRYLISWLVISLIKLRHYHSGSQQQSLVQIFGPSRKYDRGASMAFNLYAWDGLLLQPALVQKLADRNGISLGLAEIKNVERLAGSSNADSIGSSCKSCSSSSASEFLAVTVALSYVSNFEDVYRVWEFVAKFLDADFVNKEAWRYHSLNQEIVVLGSNFR